MSSESDVLTFEDEELDAKDACEKTLVNGSIIPEWAQLLEPVKKLPTNVGTRIRKCVYDALLKDPPEWAKKILEHSISKEVYKGNASGPTKVLLNGTSVMHLLLQFNVFFFCIEYKFYTRKCCMCLFDQLL